MQEVIGAQQIRIARRRDRLGQHAGPAVDLLGAVLAPDPQRIQHRGDARGRQLPVIGDHRRDRIPEHLWARHVMRFEMVGVQLDQAGHDQVAAGVLAARGRVALAELGDAAIGESDPAALDHAIGQHDAGIAEDGLVAVVISHLFLHAAAANDVTSTIRSAIRWRISSSWTIATIATPWRFFSSISSTTTARLAASSEAVGSSSSRIGRSEMKPRAMLTRCCSPPEKVDGGSAHSRSGMLRRRSSAPACSRASVARRSVRDQRLGDDVDGRRPAAPRAGTG